MTTAYANATHVGHIEEASTGSYLTVLLVDGTIHDRHFPSREVYKLGTVLAMEIKERRLLQRRAPRRRFDQINLDQIQRLQTDIMGNHLRMIKWLALCLGGGVPRTAHRARNPSRTHSRGIPFPIPPSH